MPCFCRNPANCLVCMLDEPNARLSILADRLELVLTDDDEECEPTTFAVEPRQRLGRNGVRRG